VGSQVASRAGGVVDVELPLGCLDALPHQTGLDCSLEGRFGTAQS
jgi:hypothetical protein